MIKTLVAQAKNTLLAHKKALGSVVVLVVLLGVLSVGAHAMFQVRGVVTGVSNNSIAVADFFRTQTVDLTGSPVNAANIKIGDKVKIQKNLQGNILYVRTYSEKDDEHKHERKHP
jgi:hypothetical protein